MRLVNTHTGAPIRAHEGAYCMQDPTQNSPRVLRRQNGIIGGVCGGLGAYFGVTPWLFRILFLFLHVPGIMPGLLLYIILWVAIPKADAPTPTNQRTYTPPAQTYQPPTYTPPAYTPPEQTPPPGKYD
jgi:phage shock protein PspC (stress-responsive transcriptional regulator)